MVVASLVFGAMSWAPVAIAIIGPGGVLGLVVVMAIGAMGLTSRLEDLFGLEGPTIYMLVSVVMGVVFWWAVTLFVLLLGRRKLLAQKPAHFER